MIMDFPLLGIAHWHQNGTDLVRWKVDNFIANGVIVDNCFSGDFPFGIFSTFRS